jgi:hypothetical protein
MTLPIQMTTPAMTSLRELNSRITDGIHVRMLWCETEARVVVAVTDMKTGEAFSLEVRDGEHAHEVFTHPYAFAAWHRVHTRRRPSPADESETADLESLAA